MIKTINLMGSEMMVTKLGGDNTEIFNNSEGTIYASKLSNITIGGDEVIAILAGVIDGLYGTHGTLYLLGTGSVELRGVDHKITKCAVSRQQPQAGQESPKAMLTISAMKFSKAQTLMQTLNIRKSL